jgi:hypothetical protein
LYCYNADPKYSEFSVLFRVFECRPIFFSFSVTPLYSKDTIFCGYSMPHPSEAVVNIRLQTQTQPVIEVFRDGLAQLVDVAEHIGNVFDTALETGPVDDPSVIPSSSNTMNNGSNSGTTSSSSKSHTSSSSKSKKVGKNNNVNDSIDMEEEDEDTAKKQKKKTKG